MKIDYITQIPLLIELQKFDLKLLELHSSKEAMPLQLEEWITRLDEKKSDVEALEEDIQAVKVEIKEKELELQVAEENIKKFQQQLMQIKSNKEYKALLHEIAGKKADNSCIEDAILDLMDKLEQSELSVNRENAKSKEIEKEFQQEEIRIKKEMQKVDVAIKEEEIKREAIAVKVDKELLSIYNRLLVNKGGLAIVPVIDGACGGCYLSLRPQAINEIKRADSLVTCERCSRIFYLDE
ncbi:MAG: C4-type zinc ribbon domain-containing protein [Candidatus Saelkia tenebricola]|nr:C4-type zinc ribbon domain-containing protein [Candidatus Saelkia tenebricola]